MQQGKLTARDRAILKKEAGIRSVQMLRERRDAHGYPDYLLEGQDQCGTTSRGWWNSGESIADIRWEEEQLSGWPPAVAIHQTISRGGI